MPDAPSTPQPDNFAIKIAMFVIDYCAQHIEGFFSLTGPLNWGLTQPPEPMTITVNGQQRQAHHLHLAARIWRRVDGERAEGETELRAAQVQFEATAVVDADGQLSLAAFSN